MELRRRCDPAENKRFRMGFSDLRKKKKRLKREMCKNGCTSSPECDTYRGRSEVG